MIHTLYKRNSSGTPLTWEIFVNANGDITINHGIVGGTIHREVITSTLAGGIEKEIASRIDSKRKEGYKYLHELFDNAPDKVDAASLRNYLNTYLPKYNGSSDGTILPMLCKTLENNRPFEKYGIHRGQWKINGERCIIGAVEDSSDMFHPIRLTFQSRIGVVWKLPYLEEKLLNIIPEDFIDMMIEEHACLDGELYYPGLKINDINHLIKNPTDPRHKDLQFWLYDLAIEDTIYSERRKLLVNGFDKYITTFHGDINEHLNNKSTLVLLPEITVGNYNEAIIYRDHFIFMGFEGLIIRNPNAEYGFGHKRSVELMHKFKKIEDGYFVIIDIIPEGKKREDLCKLVLKNDITEDTFECTLNAPHSFQRMVLKEKEKYIGHNAFVEYRERSGISQVPFHAKAIKID